jgi:hypothetical protein
VVVADRQVDAPVRDHAIIDADDGTVPPSSVLELDRSLVPVEGDRPPADIHGSEDSGGEAPDTLPFRPPAGPNPRANRLPTQTAALVFIALSTAIAMGFAIEAALVPARRAGVGRAGLALIGLTIALIPLAPTVGILAGASVEASVVLLLVPVLAAAIVSGWFSGRTTALGQNADQQVLSDVQVAAERLEVGDVDGALSDLRAVRRSASLETATYVDLWIRLANEEVQRRDGVRVSSSPTQQAISAEYARIASKRGRPPLVVVVGILVLGACVSIAVPMARGDLNAGQTACAAAQPILATAEASPRTSLVVDPMLSHLVVDDPGVAAKLVGDGGMRLEQAAMSRHDPKAGVKLQAAGFVAAYRRDWETPDGHTLSADIFQFATPKGAARFHRQMTEYACRFSSLAFAGTDNQTGLRINYSTGDPVVEQLAWVDGPYRVVVARSYAAPPVDHAGIQDLAFRAEKLLAGFR